MQSGCNSERFAINLRDYRIKDNSGERIEDKPIADKEPDLLRTIHDLRPIRDNIARGWLPMPDQQSCRYIYLQRALLPRPYLPAKA